ncbi:hypothetical protein V6N13_094874 [Hibiscus sabdariffa]|uniref:Secreted protein n=1 Tax=Hibiscus sabdariffa TaxID=183260 RepID=A0ABR2PTG7_9ROSI
MFCSLFVFNRVLAFLVREITEVKLSEVLQLDSSPWIWYRTAIIEDSVSNCHGLYFGKQRVVVLCISYQRTSKEVDRFLRVTLTILLQLPNKRRFCMDFLLKMS